MNLMHTPLQFTRPQHINFLNLLFQRSTRKTTKAANPPAQQQLQLKNSLSELKPEQMASMQKGLCLPRSQKTRPLKQSLSINQQTPHLLYANIFSFGPSTATHALPRGCVWPSFQYKEVARATCYIT